MITAQTVMANPKLKIKFGSQTLECSGGASILQNHHSQINRSQITTPICKKRGPQGALEGQSEKRLKMGRSVSRQCSAILKALLMHKFAWAFNHPVDPVKMNIPDYFSVISNPMDLGTIKSKLQKYMYGSAGEFAADVRLTFSNAMLYNPPTNDFHIMALKLNDIFESKWKSMEAKLDLEGLKVGDIKVSTKNTKEVTEPVHTGPKTPPIHNVVIIRRPKLSEEEMVKTSTVAAPSAERKLTEPAKNCEQNHGPQEHNKGTDPSAKNQIEGTCDAKSSSSPVASKCGKCSADCCQCSLSGDAPHTSSDLSLGISACDSDPGCSSNSTKQTKSISEISKPERDSDGIFDEQMSPARALRAAIVKQRFAHIILKARHETLGQGDKADPVKLQQEKERLERMQHEEKVRLEAQIRAAEAASQRREEIEMQKRREREREAARLKLQKMEKTVEIHENNRGVLKELEMLSGCSLSYNTHVGIVGNMLEQLGLFRKEDVENFDEDNIFDGEEGEILW